MPGAERDRQERNGLSPVKGDENLSVTTGSMRELDRLLLRVSERFSNYQRLPPYADKIAARLGYSFEYASDQLDLDGARFDFLGRGLKPDGLSVMEIGCNLGYFLLRLACENGCEARGYEPIAAYKDCIDRLAEIGCVDASVSVVPRGVGLADIAELPSVDLLIELNVLHHAGPVFDAPAVADSGGWADYARARLRALATKAEHLLFQTGNSAGNETLFASESAATFTHALLSESGWEVLRIGSVTDLAQLRYTDISGDQPELATAYACHRDPQTGLVEYLRDGELCGRLATGLANRPIWLCRSRYVSPGDGNGRVSF
jgi:hypothetical protein